MLACAARSRPGHVLKCIRIILGSFVQVAVRRIRQQELEEFRLEARIVAITKVVSSQGGVVFQQVVRAQILEVKGGPIRLAVDDRNDRTDENVG